ncbi:MAG: hypothetical protein MZW92_22360 [Comamonadaceae bacterium]|nr:hypothetical protein [Comamonadaceae bacterium]
MHHAPDDERHRVRQLGRSRPGRLHRRVASATTRSTPTSGIDEDGTPWPRVRQLLGRHPCSSSSTPTAAELGHGDDSNIARASEIEARGAVPALRLLLPRS